MQGVINTLLSIFMLISTGFIIRRYWLTVPSVWTGLEQLTLYCLFPVLLILRISQADFVLKEMWQAGSIVLIATLLAAALCILSQLYWRWLPASFTSVFQGAIRFNSYLFIIVADYLYLKQGAELAAMMMALMVIVCNILSVLILSLYGDKGHFSLRFVMMSLVKNPLIVSVLIGGVVRIFPNEAIPQFFMQYLTYLANIATPISCLLIGAGLRLIMPKAQLVAMLVSIIIKQLCLPFIVAILLIIWGIQGGTVFNMTVLYSTMPVATSAYVLSRQMGGDSDLMAAITTWGTLSALLTLPLCLWILGSVS